MKKILFILFFVLIGLSCNARIYNNIIYFDKFDDEVKSEQRKTLVTRTDSTFIVEEKGKSPVVYYIFNSVPYETKGSKDEIVNLIEDVYGYEVTWCVVRSDMLADFKEVYHKYKQEESEANFEKLRPFFLFLVHRTITTQFAGSYITELLWILDQSSDGKLGKDVNRIIYTCD